MTPDYAFKTVEDYEALSGLKVNEAFRIGWNMARTTNQHLGILAAGEPDPELDADKSRARAGLPPFSGRTDRTAG